MLKLTHFYFNMIHGLLQKYAKGIRKFPKLVNRIIFLNKISKFSLQMFEKYLKMCKKNNEIFNKIFTKEKKMRTISNKTHGKSSKKMRTTLT